MTGLDVLFEELQNGDKSAAKKMKVAQLRKELQRRGLPTGGLKAQLIARIVEDDGDNKEEDPAPMADDPEPSSKKRKRSKPQEEEDGEEEEQKDPESDTSESEEPKRKSRRQQKKRQAADLEVENDKSDWDLEWSTPVSGDHTFLLMNSKSIKGSEKIASFDYDWTIGNPKSGKFANGRKDWVWWDKVVPKNLKKLHTDGYKVVFFTNQAGIEKNRVNVPGLQGKFIDIAKELGFPFQVYISAATNHNRKPNTTMWSYLESSGNGGVKVDRSKSFYVGDAAGREKAWQSGAKRDFSVSDRKFAANIGIKFLTPEEHFLGQKPTSKWVWRSLDPVKLMDESKYGGVERVPKSTTLASDSTEVVLFCGFPASGKSTFARRNFVSKGYTWVNRDTLKTPARCLRAAEESLSNDKSVVIDNTNPDRSSREPYVKAAKSAGVPIRCFWFQTSREIADHLNFCREKQTDGGVRRVPGVGFGMFKKRFSQPQKAEGFSEVLKVNFKPEFENESDRKLFKLWT